MNHHRLSSTFLDIHRPSFTLMNLHSPSFTFTNLHRQSSTFMNLHSPSSTFTNLHKPSFTFMNLHRPSSTLMNLHRPLSTFMNLHRSSSTFMNRQNYNTCPKTVFPTKSSRFHEMLAIICFEQILQNISHNCELIMEIIHLSRFSEVQGLPIHLAPMWEGFKTCTNWRIKYIIFFMLFVLNKQCFFFFIKNT